jgi:hypothetical protein
MDLRWMQIHPYLIDNDNNFQNAHETSSVLAKTGRKVRLVAPDTELAGFTRCNSLAYP